MKAIRGFRMVAFCIPCTACCHRGREPLGLARIWSPFVAAFSRRSLTFGSPLCHKDSTTIVVLSYSVSYHHQPTVVIVVIYRTSSFFFREVVTMGVIAG